jgi:hypothetical protein
LLSSRFQQRPWAAAKARTARAMFFSMVMVSLRFVAGSVPVDEGKAKPRPARRQRIIVNAATILENA